MTGRVLVYDLEFAGEPLPENVVGAIEEAGPASILSGPVEVHVHSTRRRLADHWSSAQEGVLRDGAPVYPVGRGWLWDAVELVGELEGATWRDGAVVSLLLTSAWGPEAATRVRIYRLGLVTVADLVSAGLDEPPLPSLDRP